MKQVKALYCLTIGFIHGARLDKTNNYDVANGGYSLKAPFTGVTFVKLCDINQPLHHAGQTYIFGFAPQELVRIAALTKKDLEDALMVEQNWVTTTRKKIQSGWEKVVAAATTEAQAVERVGGEPPVPPAATPSNFTPAATPPMMASEEPTSKAEPSPPAVTEPQPATPPTEQQQTTPPAESAPETGTVGRPINAFNIYVASAKASASDSQSVGYCTFVKNLQTGEIAEMGKGGYTDNYGKMIVLALKTAFEAGIIPPSTKTSEVLATVYTSNEFVANMFIKNYLRYYAGKDWKKKDGADLANKDEWKAVWAQASHMVSRAVLCEPNSDELKVCTAKAQEFAEADHKKRYGLIPPNSEE